tara:strand:+ start:2350 stop:2922 length:573 start_codon:yes stop_codon:yes gene_type:complete
MKPLIIDNLLPDIIHKNISDDLLEQKYYVLDNLSGEKSPKQQIENISITDNQVGLGTTIFDGKVGVVDKERFGVYSLLIDYMQDKTDFKVHKLFRIRIGINLNINTQGTHNPHIDFKFPHNTLLFYVNDADGDTVFYEEFYNGYEQDKYNVQMTNTPKANQAVLFNGLQYHSSSNPIKSQYRAAININFE